MQREHATSKDDAQPSLEPDSIDVKVIKDLPTSQHNSFTMAHHYVQHLKKLSITSSRRLSRAQLKDYLKQHTFNDITAELTIGSITNLQTIACSPTSQNVRRVTLIGNPESFPVEHQDALSRTLRGAMRKFLGLKVLVIKMMSRLLCGDPQIDNRRKLCLNTIAHGIDQASFHCIREIRVELDEQFDLPHLLAISTYNVPYRTRTKNRRWKPTWNSLQRVHFVGIWTANILDLSEEARMTAISSNSGSDLPAGLRIALRTAVRSNEGWTPNDAHLKVWSEVLNVRPTPANFRIDKIHDDGMIKTHSIVAFSHASTKKETSARVLQNLNGSRELCIPEELERLPAKVWLDERTTLENSHGLVCLELIVHDANAKDICEAIARNTYSLQFVRLDVCLSSGTWDQIFCQLARCYRIVEVKAFGKGLRYATSNGPRATGYLKLGRQLPAHVIRWADRHALSTLMRTVQFTRKELGFSRIKDVAWTSVIQRYSPWEDYNLCEIFGAARRFDERCWGGLRSWRLCDFLAAPAPVIGSWL